MYGAAWGCGTPGARRVREDIKGPRLCCVDDRTGLVYTLPMHHVSPVRPAALSPQERGRKLPIDLTVTVLTTGFWPTYKSTELALPREMADSVEVYREYYDTDSKHRWAACVGGGGGGGGGVALGH